MMSAPHSGCRNAVAEMTAIRGKLPRPNASLDDMKIRTPITARRATWRDRFLEIARQVDGIEVRSGAAPAAATRRRARMAGFATLRRAYAR